MKKIMALILCLCFTALLFSGCGAAAPIMKIEGTNFSNGVYLYYQMQAMSEANKLAVDDGLPLLETTVRGVPAAEWVQKRTIEMCQTHVYIDKSCETEGLALTEDVKKTVDTETDATWEKFGAQFEKNGITKEDYKTAMLNMKKSDMIFDNLYSDMQKTVTDDEIKEYIEAQLATIQRVIIPLSDAYGNMASDEVVAAHSTFAQDLLSKLQDGESFEALIATLPEMYAAVGVAQEDVLTAEEYLVTEPVNLIPEFDFGKLITSVEVGEYGIYTDEFKAIIFKRVPNATSAIDLEFYRTMLPAIRKQTEYKEILSAEAVKLAYEFNESAAKTMGPEKIIQIDLPPM